MEINTFEWVEYLFLRKDFCVKLDDKAEIILE